jgi:hypothetical protein
VADLAHHAKVAPDRMDRVLGDLARGSNRLLQPIETPGVSTDSRRYEILHDVLARPILAWKEEFEAMKNACAARRRRLRRALDAARRMQFRSAIAGLTAEARSSRRQLRIMAAIVSLTAVLTWILTRPRGRTTRQDGQA